MGRLNRKRKNEPVVDRISFIKRLTKPIKEDLEMGVRERKAAKVAALKEIRRIGKWQFENSLMSQALNAHPSRFEGLTEGDMNTCISYGNSRLCDMGFDPVNVDPLVDEGVCLDLWDSPVEKKLVEVPSSKLRGLAKSWTEKINWRGPVVGEELKKETGEPTLRKFRASSFEQKIYEPAEPPMVTIDYGSVELRAVNVKEFLSVDSVTEEAEEMEDESPVCGAGSLHEKWAERQLSSKEVERILEVPFDHPFPYGESKDSESNKK